MKNSKQQYFFVDEAGDPTFYNREGKLIIGTEGCSKILLMGFIMTSSPHQLRKEILKLHHEVAHDPYLKDIPSLSKTARAFHAKDDTSEVREKVFKSILQLDFAAEFIVARKIEKVFRGKYRAKTHLFYDDLIIQLLKNKLHLAEESVIYFATRGSKTRQRPLEDAIQVAINAFEKQWNIKNESSIRILPQSPSDEPCLQIVDYMNWAVQRAFQKGDNRYLKFVQEKISFLCDIYDFKKYPNNFYNRKNAFDINKMSPL